MPDNSCCGTAWPTTNNRNNGLNKIYDIKQAFYIRTRTHTIRVIAYYIVVSTHNIVVITHNIVVITHNTGAITQYYDYMLVISHNTRFIKHNSWVVNALVKRGTSHLCNLIRSEAINNMITIDLFFVYTDELFPTTLRPCA